MVKTKNTFFGIVITVALLCSSLPLLAQNTQRTNVLFVIDVSFSMKKEWEGGTKWRSAVKTLNQIVDSLAKVDNMYLGLRLFGHQSYESETNCRDSKLEVFLTPAKLARDKFHAKLASVKPKGITPIGYSLERAVNDFGDDASAKNILILITDGEESCGKDPCAISRGLQEKGIITKPFVIGMALPPGMINNFKCAGDAINVNSDIDLNRTLRNLVDEAIAKTTITIGLLDQNKKPTETGCPVTFYDRHTGIAKQHLYHTLNPRGYPDTLTISPIFDYDIQIHTLPQLWIRNIRLQKNRHNDYNVNAPQGFISFSLKGKSATKSSLLDRIKCIVHQNDSIELVNVQSLNTEVKYLTGKYDLEIMTLPRIYLDKVSVDANKVTHIEVPQPGFLTINKTLEFYGAIFVEKKDVLEKIHDLKIEQKQETLTLQPGEYRIVYRSKNARSGHNSIDKSFLITSGGSISIRL